MKTIILFILSTFIFSSCIVVKYNGSKSRPSKIELAPKPSIMMSDTYVRSDFGDMVALLPNDWFFVDLDSLTNNDIIAVASNPEYNLSLVFSKIRTTNPKQDKYLQAIAHSSLNKKISKSGGKVEMIGNYTDIHIAHKHFVSYQISTTSGALLSSVAVFKSEYDNFYEITLIPMNIMDNNVPQHSEMMNIFNSVLATVRY